VTPAASITNYCGVQGDAQGGWMKIVNVASIAACKAQCSSASGCISFAIFDETDCYLYSTEASVNNIESDWTDGPFTFWDLNCPTVYPDACANPSQWQILNSYSISNVGSTGALVSASNNQDCCTQCQTTENCMTWSYSYSWMDGWSCALSTSMTNPYAQQATSDACPNGIAKLTGVGYSSGTPTTFFSAIGPCGVVA